MLLNLTRPFPILQVPGRVPQASDDQALEYALSRRSVTTAPE